MPFRKIRPSFGNSSVSTSNPSQSTSESTGSDPCRVVGEKEAEGSSSSSKRRRVPESVTRNACLNCKKARAKCDGKKPCKRCASHVDAPECIYEVHIKHAKEELVKQIKELRRKDHLTEQILQALSSDEKVPDILERLKSGETYASIVEWLGRSPMDPMDDFEILSPKESHHSTFETSDHEMGGIDSKTFHWTYVTTDRAVLDHLFQLYFAWVHPVHTLFSEGHFVDSYKWQSDNYCSPTLVNAICAVACHLHSVAEADEVDFDQLSAEFSDAVQASIDADDRSITTIQAFAVMFLVDCARANALRATAYLKVATNNIPKVALLESEGFHEVWKNTIRGVHCLNVEWAQMTFQIPPTMNTSLFEGIGDTDDKLDEAKWYFYRYVNDQCPAWPGLQATTNREKLKLVGIINDSATMMYDHHGPKLGAHDVLRLYSRLVTWREELPSSIGNIEGNNSQALPHVLSLLILYSNTVVHLLRPLLDLEGFPSSSVEEVVWKNAQEGLFLLDEHYRRQYTCRYQPVLQMLCALHITDVIARFFPNANDRTSKDGPAAMQFGTELLIQSYAGFPVAGPFQEMLQRTTLECSITLPKNLREVMAAPVLKRRYRMDDLIDACTQPTYVQPVGQIHNRYLPSLCVDWATKGASYGFEEPPSGSGRFRVLSVEERGAQSLMQIHNLLNNY